MAVVGELLVLIGANTTALTAGLAKSEAELKGFAGTSGGAASAAALPLAVLAAGSVLVGVEATKSASKFQAAMELIHTQAGGTQAEVNRMTAAVLALAPAVGTGPEALATGLYHIESAGIRGAKALDVLKIAAEGAKVGHADLESVTNALVAEVNSGIGGVKNMSQAMGVLNAIVGAGNMRMQDLTGAFTTGVLSAAKNFGVSVQSVGAALATMTNAGVPAEEAATRLRMTLSLIGAPTAKAVGELKSIGLSSRALADDMRGPGGIMAAVADLSTHLQKSGLDATEQAALISHAFGGGRSSGAIMLLLGSLEKFRTVQEQVNKGTGTFGEAWKATAAEVETQAAKTGASIGTIVDAIGLGLLPKVGQIFAAINPVVASLANWASTNQGTAATILIVSGGVAALVAGILLLGPILDAVGTAIGVITSPIILVIAAVGALAAHFGLLGSGAKSAVDGIGAKINSLVPATGPLRIAFAAIGTAVAAIPDAIATAQSAIMGLVDSANWLAAAFGPGIIAAAQSAFASLSSAISTVTSAITAFVTSASNQRTALTLVGQAADGVRAAIGWVSSAIGVVAGWINTFVTHLTNAHSAASGAGVTFNSVAAAIRSIASTIATVVTNIATFVAKAIDAANKMGVFKVAGDAINATFGAIGDAIRATVTVAGLLATALNTSLSTAFSLIKVVIDGITKAITDATAAIQAMIDLAGKAVEVVTHLSKDTSVVVPGGPAGSGVSAPGVSGPGAVPIGPPIPGGATGPIPGGATGGIASVVPGTGPALFMLHGGERITPAGQSSGGPIQLTAHFHVEIGGEKIGEWIERRLFNDASGFSSGFAPGSVGG